MRSLDTACIGGLSSKWELSEARAKLMVSYYNAMEGGNATRDELDGFGELSDIFAGSKCPADVAQTCGNPCRRMWGESTFDQTEGISSFRQIKFGHDRQMSSTVHKNIQTLQTPYIELSDRRCTTGPCIAYTISPRFINFQLDFQREPIGASPRAKYESSMRYSPELPSDVPDT